MLTDYAALVARLTAVGSSSCLFEDEAETIMAAADAIEALVREAETLRRQAGEDDAYEERLCEDLDTMRPELDRLKDEVERLTRERDFARNDQQRHIDNAVLFLNRAEEAEAEASRLRAENERLRDALQSAANSMVYEVSHPEPLPPERRKCLTDAANAAIKSLAEGGEKR